MPTLPFEHTFASNIVSWFGVHGRHDLPWQQLNKPNPDPYPVWISEIMLQQTQVATVIGYYTRFMENFPTLDALADAPLDAVLDNWAGLGYYARARNLHKTAQALQHIINTTDAYPQTLESWQALAGIGHSTAGAIMAMGMGKFGVICDGNVKRVLTRHFGIDGDITKPATDRLLWELASTHTPKDNSGHYAQAMMDMGATLCTRTRPDCTHCPVATTCIAHQNGNPTAYPVKAKKSPKPTHQSLALLLTYQDQTLWLKRPPDGIWGGLWCLPLLSTTLQATLNDTLLIDSLALEMSQFAPAHHIRHTLTHFHWELAPIVHPLTKSDFDHINTLLRHANAEFGWYNNQNQLAKPAAITKLLDLL